MIKLKLINFLDNPELNALRFAMGAPLIDSYAPARQGSLLDEDEIRRLGQEGIDVSSEQIKVEENRTLSYRGKRVLVYIRDVADYGHQQAMPRFHMSYCRTLDKMWKSKRWSRYVVATREDGLFQVNLIGEKTDFKMLKLSVCQNCLETLGWEKFSINRMSISRRKEIVSNFSITEFFKKYPKDLISVTPENNADTAPLNDYTNDWPQVSETIKQVRGFTCENCGLRLSNNDRKFLHAHHKDGQKNNNRPDNIEILCLKCHAEEPMHAHLKNGRNYSDFMQRFGSAT